MKTAADPIEEPLVRRICGEYEEMPGPSLTEAQAARLWNLNQKRCKIVLLRLLRARFLHCTRDGRYVMSTGSEV
jgi:hypothetical protein